MNRRIHIQQITHNRFGIQLTIDFGSPPDPKILGSSLLEPKFLQDPGRVQV